MPFQVTKDPVERICCLPVCNNQKFTLTHKFPGTEERCDQWLLALDIPKLYSVPREKLIRSYFICTRHFRDEDYKFLTSRHLNLTAIPSLNLRSLDQLDMVSSRWKNSNIIINKEESIENDILSENDLLLSKDVEQFELNEVLEHENIEKSDEILTDFTIEMDSEPDNLVTDHNSFISQQQILKRNLLKSRLKDLDDDFPVIEGKRFKSDTIVQSKTNYKVTYINKDIEDQSITLGEDGENELVNEEYNLDELKLDSLNITHPDYPDGIEINLFWLRDHCKCNLCYNYETHQRKTNILDMPLEIALQETDFTEDKLFVKWEDGHDSNYDLEFLHKSQYKEQILMNSIEYLVWDKSKIEKENYFAEVNFGNFLSDENIAIKVLSSIVKYGLAVIKGVPPTTDMTEMTIKRLFPVQKTFFGEMWTFTSNKEKADTAYTTEYLAPHTDNTYFCDAAGLQIFHCIKHNGTGGDSIFVDGFKAIELLQLEDQEYVDILTKVNVSSEYIDKEQHHKHCAPIIQLDPIHLQLQQIRFNLYDRGDLNGLQLNETKLFYKSLRKLTEIIYDENNMFKYKLDPGTVVIFDNWRVLHGREAFSGERVMTGCYVSRTDFMSKARTLGLIK